MRLEQRPNGLFQVIRTPEEASRLAAVGRERVSETGIDEQALETAVQVYTDGQWSDVPFANYYDTSRDGMRAAVTAYLTAAPPERHDAPGVSREQLAEELYVADYLETSNGEQDCRGRWQRYSLKHSGIKRDYLARADVALKVLGFTGQPDAGRDPDAADAGGE